MRPSQSLPRATEAEQQVLGAALLAPERAGEILGRLRPDDFVDDSHRAVFLAIEAMRRLGAPLDPPAVAARLMADDVFARAGLEPRAYLGELGKSIVHASHGPYYAGLVAEAGVKRRLWRLASDAADDARNGKASREVIADLRAALDDVETHDGQHERYTLRDLIAKHPTLTPPVIDGLIREGETANIVSHTKAGKSWLTYGLALSKITGQPWLGRFDAAPAGRVLLVDNELAKPTIAHRIPTVGDALGIRRSGYESDLEVWPLRGKLCSLADLAPRFAAIEPGQFALIILDAKYRFAAAGASENDNAAEARTYNLIDEIAERTRAAIVLVHHTTKGTQSDKRVTDVGAGAGAQSRAADCHLILREHELDDVVVLEAAVRSFPPVKPVALRWTFPLWTPDLSIDCGALRDKHTQQDRRQGERDKAGVDAIVKALLGGPATARQLRPMTGISKDRQQRLLDLLESQGHVTSQESQIRGNSCKVYDLAK